MQCPVCGCTRLKLGMVFSGEVACTFHDGAVVEVLHAAELDSYWDEHSPCQCIECLWSGRVGDLKPANSLANENRTESRFDAESRLGEIEREVLNGECPPPIRKDVRKLIQIVRQLQKHVRVLETVRRAAAKGHLVQNGDTAVL